MTTRYDICSGRPKKDGGTYWHRIGSMMPNDKGGFSIKLDSLPLPNKDGDVWVQAFPPKDQQDSRPARNSQSQRSARDDVGESIPF